MLKLLNLLYGNRIGQEMLTSVVRKCHRYMGIGTGDDVFTSGEKAVIALVKTLRRPPYCIFDVGSHKGEYLEMALSVMAGEEFQIHCFEPARRLFAALTERIAGDSRVVANNCALGREKGEVQLFYETDDAGGSLTKRRLDHLAIYYGQSEMVNISTIDEYCDAHAIDRIHLLKADIEGHELELFVGAKRMLERRAIQIITFEFGGCNIDTHTYFQDYYYFFREQDMSLFRITPSGFLYPLKGYGEMDEQFKTTNFAAILNRG